MRKVVSGIFAGLAWIVFAAVVAQFFFAGLGIFGASDFRAHRLNGSLLLPTSLVLLLLALIGRLGMVRIGLTGLLLVLIFVQNLLVRGPSLVAALHPLNAVAILLVSLALARRGLAGRAISRTPRSGLNVSEQPLSRVR
jgi:hypothetical protein